MNVLVTSDTAVPSYTKDYAAILSVLSYAPLLSFCFHLLPCLYLGAL